MLIVEDDYSLRLLYKKILDLSGFQVIGEATNGEEAISLYKSLEEKPEIIIMDHRMPIKDGLETSKELFQLNENVKIIFASADTSIKEKALAIGAVAFLEKPFSCNLLVEVAEKVLKNHDNTHNLNE